MGLARPHRPKRPSDDLFVYSSQLLASSGKKPSDHRKTMGDRFRARWRELYRSALSSQAIKAFGMRSLIPNRPKRVGQMLFYQRNLGLNCEFDVFQVRIGAPVWRDPGQNPGAALLVHQSPRSVNRINYDA